MALRWVCMSVLGSLRRKVILFPLTTLVLMMTPALYFRSRLTAEHHEALRYKMRSAELQRESIRARTALRHHSAAKVAQTHGIGPQLPPPPPPYTLLPCQKPRAPTTDTGEFVRPTRPLIWPLPKNYSSGSVTLAVVPSSGFFSFLDSAREGSANDTGHGSELLTAAFRRYELLTFPNPASTEPIQEQFESGSGSWQGESDSILISRGECKSISAYVDDTWCALNCNHNQASCLPKKCKCRHDIVVRAVLTGLDVTADSTSEDFPQLDTDESYTLKIPANGGRAMLNAPTVYGCLRGLETFSQLVRFQFEVARYTLSHAPWIIHDEPRFQHRGLLIDTGRHFLPIVTIKRIIDSLPFAKLNVLQCAAPLSSRCVRN